MAINIDGKTYRNIQEQVQKNQDDIKDLKTNISEVEEDQNNFVTKSQLAGNVNVGSLETGGVTSDVVRVDLLVPSTSDGDHFTIFEDAAGDLTIETPNEERAVIIQNDAFTNPIVKVSDDYKLVSKEAQVNSVIVDHLTFKNGSDYGLYSYDDGDTEVKVLEYDTDRTSDLKFCLDISLSQYSNYQYQTLFIDGNGRTSGVRMLQCTLYFSNPDSEDICLQFLTEDDETMLYYKIGGDSTIEGLWFSLYGNEVIQVTEVDGSGNIIANTFPKPSYRHTVTIDSSEGALCFTTVNSKNLVIDSIQDLITVFNGTKLQCSGNVGMSSNVMRLDVGSTVTNCVIFDSSLETKTLASLTNITISDDVTAVNTTL